MGRRHRESLVDRFIELKELEEIKELLKKEDKKKEEKKPEAWYKSTWKMTAILMLCWPFIGLLQLGLLKVTLMTAQKLLQ